MRRLVACFAVLLAFASGSVNAENLSERKHCGYVKYKVGGGCEQDSSSDPTCECLPGERKKGTGGEFRCRRGYYWCEGRAKGPVA